MRVVYEGRLADGSVFDTTTEPVRAGGPDLVPGFTEALQLKMNVGGRCLFSFAPTAARGTPQPPRPEGEAESPLALLADGQPLSSYCGARKDAGGGSSTAPSALRLARVVAMSAR